MARQLLLLQPTAAADHLSSSSSSPPPGLGVNSDMVVILASLLCALLCVLGLALVSRCACRCCRRSSDSPNPNKGLRKKAIDALPTVSFAAASSPKLVASSSSDCAICLADFAHGDDLRVLPRCGHAFHVACIDAWLRTHATCPSCRTTCAAPPAPAPAPVPPVAPPGDDTFLP